MIHPKPEPKPEPPKKEPSPTVALLVLWIVGFFPIWGMFLSDYIFHSMRLMTRPDWWATSASISLVVLYLLGVLFSVALWNLIRRRLFES